MKKTILLTGSSGFIGGHLANALKKNYKIYLTINKNRPKIKSKNVNFILYKNNLNFFRKLEKLKIDIIIHCATFYSKHDDVKNIKNIVDSNITFGCYLLEISKIKKIKKFINLTTNWENFRNKLENPKNFYATSKLAFKKFIHYYSKTNYDTEYFSVYLSDTFGENDNRDKLFPNLKKAIKNKKKINLVSKKLYLNIINVNDLISAINILIKKKVTPGEYSVVNNKNLKLDEIINKIKNSCKLSYKFNTNSLIHDKILKLKKIKNWKPKESTLEKIKNYLLKK